MTEYSFNDLNVLKEDTDENPKSFTPLFEVPGSLYSQDYPKRLRHTFPDTTHWREKVEVSGDGKVEKWKKKLYERYVNL